MNLPASRFAIASGLAIASITTSPKAKKHSTIIRALAFKWIRILFCCWNNQTPYDDDKYMQALKKRGSVFATLHLEKNKKTIDGATQKTTDSSIIFAEAVVFSKSRF